MAMTEHNWTATEQGRAYQNFRNYTESLGVVFLGGELGGLVTQGLGWVGRWAARNPQISSNPLPPESAEVFERMDAKHQESLRSSLIVIAGWGSFEGCIEDVVKATISADDSLLAGTNASAERIKQKHSITDADEVLDRQWRALQQQPSSKLPALERFEEMLGLVGMNGQVPPLVTDSFNVAYAIRNVWAHNAGIADHTFLGRAPDWDVELDGCVDIDKKQAAIHLSAIILYGFIILNRHRASHDLGPISNTGKPGQTLLGRAYSRLYE